MEKRPKYWLCEGRDGALEKDHHHSLAAMAMYQLKQFMAGNVILRKYNGHVGQSWRM